MVKKVIMKSVLAIVAGIGLMASSSFADPTPAEYTTITPTSLVSSTAPTLLGKGYYIWADDANLTSWHIRWEDDNINPLRVNNGDPNDDYKHLFTGDITLINNSGNFSTYSFESNDYFESTYAGGSFFSFIKLGEDGIDFTIAQIVAPSYVAFNLSEDSAPMDADYIFLGPNHQTVASLIGDQDFKIAAPIPEPGVTLLFGLGVAGFVGMIRRRNTLAD